HKIQIIKEQLLLKSNHDALGTSSCGLYKEQRYCNEKGIDVITHFSMQPCCATLYPGKCSSRPLGYLTCWTVDLFAQFLQGAYSSKQSSKENNILISPAIFDPDRAKGTNRGIGNIVYLQHLWLDFENGDLRPKEFAAVFPQIKMLITNTY